jgi:hypothetical protein
MRVECVGTERFNWHPYNISGVLTRTLGCASQFVMLVSRLLAICGVLAPAMVHALPEVKARGTTISGRDISSDVEFFGGQTFFLLFVPQSGPNSCLYVGIPFAEPPVGALRLRPPVLKLRLNTTDFEAGDHGKACIQPVCRRSRSPVVHSLLISTCISLGGQSLQLSPRIA